ncbi:MAG: hypothetical protein ACTS73_04125 [Arsenophonus sp. NEOnobi-MAG3]
MMMLHRQATTAPKIFAALQTSKEIAFILYKRYGGISELTVAKGKKRYDVNDHSHI